MELKITARDNLTVQASTDYMSEGLRAWKDRAKNVAELKAYKAKAAERHREDTAKIKSLRLAASGTQEMPVMHNTVRELREMLQRLEEGGLGDARVTTGRVGYSITRRPGERSTDTNRLDIRCIKLLEDPLDARLRRCELEPAAEAEILPVVVLGQSFPDFMLEGVEEEEDDSDEDDEEEEDDEDEDDDEEDEVPVRGYKKPSRI